MYNELGVNLNTPKTIDKCVVFWYYFHAVKGIPHRKGLKAQSAP